VAKHHGAFKADFGIESFFKTIRELKEEISREISEKFPYFSINK
jgi:hypothetical protein